MKRNHFTRALLTLLCFCLAAAFSISALADTSRFEASTSRDENNNICIDFPEVQVVLPSDWAGKVQMNISTDYVSFYHIDSRNALTEELGFENGGHLFSICFTTTEDYVDYPSYMVIGKTTEGTYYAEFPTDLQAYTEDIDIYNEYFSLANDMDWVKANITLTIETILTVDSEYIFTDSAAAYLTGDDLAGMTADEVQMAINEIYARHHRKFLKDDVQAYFDSKSWYSGTIEAEDFDINVMNVYESANINLMVSYLDTHDFDSDTDTADTSDSEYILEQSSTSYLTESDLTTLTTDELQMAINEIYARHGRKFSKDSVQEYFNSKSWYVGTVEPDDFDTNVLNIYETANIALLLEVKEARS
ncbi:MAG: YARHG domain-containing protein [Clostridiales bacterium]|nr:YARHG domain-containing protein [Clostridiales bacterium]